MQHQQFVPWTRYNGESAPLFVTKFHERNILVQLLNNRAYLPARKSVRRKVR